MSQNIFTVAGNGVTGIGPDGVFAVASATGLVESSVAVDKDGNIYLAAWAECKVRKIDMATGIITTIAGTGVGGYNGDGIPATTAQIIHPHGVAVDKLGNVYIGESSGKRIRKIDVSTGLISTIIGNGTFGYNGDSIPASGALTSEISGLALDTAGNIYFSDLSNAMIRKIDIASGLVHKLAGNGIAGYNGDNILADTAQLNVPIGITVAENGDVYFADSGNERLRKISASTGLISTVGGTGVYGYNGDNIAADTAQLAQPWAVTIDQAGNLYLTESGQPRLRKVDTAGIISTLCGTGSSGFSGDGGPAALAQLAMPRGVFVDACGNIYISDRGNYRIRKITSLLINASSTEASCNGLCDGSVSVTASGGFGTYTYNWNGLGAGATQTNVCAGTYHVLVTDTTNCKGNLYVEISEPLPLSVNIAPTNATCFSNGSASANVSGGTSPYSYFWSTGDTTSVTAGLSAGTYSLTVTDTNDCVATQTVSVINNPNPYPSVPVCMVTVDSASQYNIVTWDKTAFTNIDSFIVLREIATGNYQPIATLPYSALSEFTDTVRTKYFPNTGDPNAGTYRYKLKMRDTCGNYSLVSPYHNTIYFLNNNGTFYWTQPYTVENAANPVSSYVLLRDDFSTGNWQPVSSVAGTQQTISDPLYSIYQNTASWRVQTQWSISCNPTLKTNAGVQSAFNSSYSNIYTNAGIGMQDHNLATFTKIYPSPNTGIFTVECAINNARLEIYNVLGEQVAAQQLHQGVNTVNAALPDGSYIARLVTEKGVVSKKVIVQR